MTRGLVAVLLLAAGCGGTSPRAIALGQEACTHCHMTIADPGFTAEAITRTGRVLAFDDVGCLAAWLRESPDEGASASGWVMSFTDRTTWLRADSAAYLRTEALRTPMASGLAAVRPGREADSLRAALGGTLLTWDAVRALPHGPGAHAS